MNVFTRNELMTLMKIPSPCVSIYMPTLREEWNLDKPDPFKNMLREAEERLVAAGLRAPEAKELLEPAQKVLLDGPFWRQTPVLPFPIPENVSLLPPSFDFEELLVVADRFNVSLTQLPLLLSVLHPGPQSKQGQAF